MSMVDHAAAEVKYSCRNLWKVYGPNAGVVSQRIREASRAGRILASDSLDVPYIPAISDVSFDLHKGEIFVIMGLSGSGKSTLVRCLSRLVEPTAGSLIYDGVDMMGVSEKQLIEIRRHRMGMVFQHFGLLPHLTVKENIGFPLKLQGVEQKVRQERVEDVLKLVGLQGREDSYPDQLSGGQQQRVGIARSLATEPDLWFLDEPFSALDPLIRRQMQDEFLRLHKSLHKTIVFITHDFDEAIRIGDRIAIMRDGRFIQVDTPLKCILSPANDYVASFTNDVRRDRLLRAGDVARSIPADTDLGESVHASTPIAELVPKLLSATRPLIVVASSGEPIGIITERSIIQSLFGSREDQPS